jgi:hypothetical protein
MGVNKTKLYTNRSVWGRALFMLLFIFLMGVAKFVTLVVVVLQFILVAFTSQTNNNLVRFGKSLSVYQYQILLFLTYNSEELPYPVSEWPV